MISDLVSTVHYLVPCTKNNDFNKCVIIFSLRSFSRLEGTNMLKNVE